MIPNFGLYKISYILFIGVLDLSPVFTKAKPRVRPKPFRVPNPSFMESRFETLVGPTLRQKLSPQKIGGEFFFWVKTHFLSK